MCSRENDQKLFLQHILSSSCNFNKRKLARLLHLKIHPISLTRTFQRIVPYFGHGDWKVSPPKGFLFCPQYVKRGICCRNSGAVVNLNEPRRSYLIYIIRIYPKQTQSHSCLTPPPLKLYSIFRRN